jgi:hypothetical protein
MDPCPKLRFPHQTWPWTTLPPSASPRRPPYLRVPPRGVWISPDRRGRVDFRNKLTLALSASTVLELRCTVPFRENDRVFL